MCAIFSSLAGCWPHMGGGHNLRLMLQIEMQISSGYPLLIYGHVLCATPDKILHSMQDNTKQLFQLPYGQHPFHIIVLHSDGRRPKLAIWFAPWLQGDGMIIHVRIAIHGNCCESHCWCTTEPCYHQDGQLVEVDYAEWLLSYDMRHSSFGLHALQTCSITL